VKEGIDSSIHAKASDWSNAVDVKMRTEMRRSFIDENAAEFVGPCVSASLRDAGKIHHVPI
jgi:hypothetical protein